MLNKLNVSGSNCLVVTGLVRDADVIIRESILMSYVTLILLFSLMVY